MKELKQSETRMLESLNFMLFYLNRFEELPRAEKFKFEFEVDVFRGVFDEIASSVDLDKFNELLRDFSSCYAWAEARQKDGRQVNRAATALSLFCSEVKKRITCDAPTLNYRKPPIDNEDSSAILQSSLLAHHNYDNSSGLNCVPLRVNQLAREVNLGAGTVSRFFKKHFESHKRYCRICDSPEELSRKLRKMSGDVRPKEFYKSIIDYT